MNVLLTGYAGNLGSAIIKAIRNEVRLDALLHGTALKPDSVPDNVKLIWGSLNDEVLIKMITAEHDVVIHSAWDGRGDEAKMKSMNLAGSINLLRSSIENKVKMFIYISSVGVYGLEKRLWSCEIDENQGYVSREHSMDPYPYVKILIEQELKKLVSDLGSDIRLLIIRPGLLFSDAKAPAKKYNERKKKAIVFGSGNNHLPFIHVDDVAELVKKIIDNMPESNIYNCVPSNRLSAKAFLAKWGNYYCDGSLKIVNLPLWLVRLMGHGVKALKKKMGKDSGGDINYPILTGIRNIRYANKKAVDEFGWTDEVTQTIADA